jgi:serine/threonine-protein kinase HipA
MALCVRERWYEIARGAGVTERDCALISGAFVYPGFRMKAGT